MGRDEQCGEAARRTGKKQSQNPHPCTSRKDWATQSLSSATRLGHPAIDDELKS